jgi:hypothetical protein
MAKGKDTAPIPGSYEPLPPHLVNELTAIGYKAEAVDSWSIEKARLTLRRYSIQANATIRRANNSAEAVDGPKLIGGPLGVLRQDAANYCSQALAAGDAADLLFSVQGAVGELSDDELKRLAAYMVTKLAGAPA